MLFLLVPLLFGFFGLFGLSEAYFSPCKNSFVEWVPVKDSLHENIRDMMKRAEKICAAFIPAKKQTSISKNKIIDTADE